MLDGWYCRTLASEQAAQQTDVEPNMSRNYESDSDSQDQEESRREQSNTAVDYKSQYRYLKRKLKYLIYENEFFQDALRSNQRRLLKASRDRAFLLDRLLQYEKPENTSSDSDETEESSEDEATKELKRKKLEQSANGTTVAAPRGRKKKAAATTSASETVNTKPSPQIPTAEATDENQQTQAEVERQLLKRSLIELIPESAPATVPAEMFSNEHSLDSQPNEQLIEVSSPTHVAAEECVPMEHSN